MKESNLARLILLATSRAGHRLFINTRGVAYRKDGTPVRYGLGPNGASDLIGYTQQGQFAALEVKTDRGRPTAEQLSFIQAVLQAGGRAGIVRTVGEALAVLGGPEGK